MVNTILNSPIVSEAILPFLLVFTLVFAILQKTKILGDGKKQIDAIVSLVVGLIFISFAQAVNISVQLMSLMALAAVVILVFMILFGFVSGDDFKMPKGLKITFGILIGILLVISLIILTGFSDKALGLFNGKSGNNIGASILFIGIIIAAVAAVLSGKKDK